MKVRLQQLGCVFVIVVASVGVARTQTPDTSGSTSSSGVGSDVTLSGEIGAYGELYAIDGISARRPASTGRLFFRPTLTLFKALSLDFDFLLSTEGNSARQDINQFGISPSWSWGQAHLGDFSENYSQFTLGGIRIRGGGFFINPGLFRFGLVGGVTKRAVYSSDDNGSYDRYLYGGKIGIGSAEGGFVDLIFLRVRDKASSLPATLQSTAIDSTDSLSSTPLNFGPTPQENLVTGLMSHLKLFSNSVIWNVEAYGSVFTRDMRANGEKPLKLPEWITNIYNPNVSSCAGIAVRTDLTMNAGNVTVRTGYKYVGPGYNSLGVGSLLNDVQEFSLSPSFRARRFQISLNGARQNDNLLGQKLNTLVRYQFGGNFNFQPTDWWSGSIIGNYLKMLNNSGNDTTLVNYVTRMLGANQYIMFPSGSLVQSITANYMFQQSADYSPLRPNIRFTSHSASTGLTFAFDENFSVTPGINVVVFMNSLQSSQTTHSYVLSAQHKAMDNALINVLSCVASYSPHVSSYRSSLGTTYRITSSASIGMMLSMMNYRTGSAYGSNFNEYTASLNITRRF
jgi:hypothetical protein